jgi:hypothetical protein
MARYAGIEKLIKFLLLKREAITSIEVHYLDDGCAENKIFVLPFSN